MQVMEKPKLRTHICDYPRDRMKRNLYLLLSLLLCLPLSAQQTCRTRVVDSETGEPVAYATVCPSSGSRVMTNAEGDFYMQTVSSDTLYISRIGYESLRIAAAQVGGRIALRPLTKTLKTVTVTPVTTEEILKRTLRRMKKEYNHNKNIWSMFFFRSTIHGKVKIRIQEGYMKARSAGNLRQTSVVSAKRFVEGETGRESYLHSTNIHRLLELGARIKDSKFWQTAVTPLDNYKRYDYSHHITMEGEDSQLLYKIDFPYMERANLMVGERQAICGSLYIDAVTYRLMRFEGMVLGMYLKSYVMAEPSDLFFDIEYRHDNSFTEVSHIVIHGGNDETRFQVSLFNLGLLEEKTERGVKLGENLLNAIDEAGDDSGIREKYEIILRTEEEEKIFMKGMEAM